MKPIAIIIARGGSKRIPRKNIKDFLGKPIIAYSIETALKSGIFENVFVSTDDEEIAEIAEKYGAKIPFMRSAENANDFATTADVLKEFINNFPVKLSREACCIYPTAPFITVDLLKQAYEKLINGNFDTVFPIQRFGFPIQRALVLRDEKLTWRNPENAQVRSQDLEPTFHDAGQFYFFRIKPFLERNTLLTKNSAGIEISEMQAHDIDNEEDWKIAEFKYQLKIRR
jgi:pseudaminic acid cytidylyltransferase